jgi:hypothetical protein
MKRTKKPSRSIQYRLLADRNLQRLSLRKVTDRLKGAKKSPRSRSKNATAEKTSKQFSWATTSGALALAMMCVVVAAALVTARQAPPRVKGSHAEGPPAAVALPGAPREREAKKPTTGKALAIVGFTPAVEPSPQAPLDAAGTVTITGCIELDDETFRLADISGVDAPTSRSWRSGFLRKRPAKVELVDATHTLRLPNHVGRRVAATGTLIDGEMRAHSLRRVATSCKS